jgi:hypothetical protein
MGILEDKTTQGADVEFPFSHDEHAAMARYLSNMRKQLQDVSDLFTSRYGKTSNIAEIAVKALVAATLLEHELMLSDEQDNGRQLEAVEQAAAGSK